MHFILLLTLASGISASPAHRFLDTSKAAGDAPYDTPEATLRAAVKILAGFTYGQKIPVIMCPGTGSDWNTNILWKLHEAACKQHHDGPSRS